MARRRTAVDSQKMIKVKHVQSGITQTVKESTYNSWKGMIFSIRGETGGIIKNHEHNGYVRVAETATKAKKAVESAEKDASE